MNYQDTLIDLVVLEGTKCESEQSCYLSNILVFVDAEIERQLEKQRGEILTLISKEIVIAQKEGQRTSRLTSLYNKVIKL